MPWIGWAMLKALLSFVSERTLWSTASLFLTMTFWPARATATCGTNMHPFWSISTASAGGGEAGASFTCTSAHFTVWLGLITMSSFTGILSPCIVAHCFSAPKLIAAGAGASPSNATLPDSVAACAGTDATQTVSRMAVKSLSANFIMISFFYGGFAVTHPGRKILSYDKLRGGAFNPPAARRITHPARLSRRMAFAVGEQTADIVELERATVFPR